MSIKKGVLHLHEITATHARAYPPDSSSAQIDCVHHKKI